jgi:thiamine biosynthesis lipoprotein
MGKALLLLAMLMAVLATACDDRQIYQHQILQFGTIISVTIATDDAELAERAFSRLERDFAAMQHNWQVWKPGPLMALNHALDAGKAATVPPDMIPLISRARQLSRESHYLFNPAAGKLIALWGFHQDRFGRDTAPAATEIKALVAANPKLDDLVIKGNVVSANNAAVKLDFGGFAKGYGLGLEAKQLKAMGINDFIINAGGDLVAYGHHPARTWIVAIRATEGRKALASIETRDGDCIFTSGDYERYYALDGKRRHHIIDPRTGYPAEGARAVTVIHTRPEVADAAATALLVAGVSEWERIAASMGVDKVLLVDQQGKLHITEAMMQRIRLLPDNAKSLQSGNNKPNSSAKTQPTSNLGS